jgi:hypothetical protein
MHTLETEVEYDYDKSNKMFNRATYLSRSTYNTKFIVNTKAK